MSTTYIQRKPTQRGVLWQVIFASYLLTRHWNILFLCQTYLELHYWVITTCYVLLRKSVTVVSREKNEPWAKKSQATTALFISTAAWSYDATDVRTGTGWSQSGTGPVCTKTGAQSRSISRYLYKSNYILIVRWRDSRSGVFRISPNGSWTHHKN